MELKLKGLKYSVLCLPDQLHGDKIGHKAFSQSAGKEKPVRDCMWLSHACDVKRTSKTELFGNSEGDSI